MKYSTAIIALILFAVPASAARYCPSSKVIFSACQSNTAEHGTPASSRTANNPGGGDDGDGDGDGDGGDGDGGGDDGGPGSGHANNGWGNGDQDAPGNSGSHNNAENNHSGKSDPSHGGNKNK